jgi:hypothetical protein
MGTGIPPTSETRPPIGGRMRYTAGFDAKYMDSGHSGWRAIGAPVRLASS